MLIRCFKHPSHSWEYSASSLSILSVSLLKHMSLKSPMFPVLLPPFFSFILFFSCHLASLLAVCLAVSMVMIQFLLSLMWCLIRFHCAVCHCFISCIICWALVFCCGKKSRPWKMSSECTDSKVWRFLIVMDMIEVDRVWARSCCKYNILLHLPLREAEALGSASCWV